jgi:hypothetical protein
MRILTANFQNQTSSFQGKRVALPKSERRIFERLSLPWHILVRRKRFEDYGQQEDSVYSKKKLQEFSQDE